MGAGFSKVIGSVVKNSASGAAKKSTANSSRAFTEAAATGHGRPAKSNLEKADELIVQKPLKQYEPLMTTDPITGKPTRKSYAARTKEAQTFDMQQAKRWGDYHAQENAALKSKPDFYKDPDILEEIGDNTKEIRNAKSRITQSKANIEKAKPVQAQLENESASTIQHHWRNRKPLTAEQRQQVRQAHQAVEAQNKKLATTGTLGYDDKIRDGFIANSNRFGLNQERLVVDRSQDARLNRFLSSGEVGNLKNSIPGKNATPEQEMAFLNNAKSIINGRYSKVSPQESLSLYEKAGKHNGTHDVNGLKIPLGNTIDAGSGICRHRSTTGKVMFDEIGVKSSLNMGSVGNHTAKPGDHVWNTVQLPSGREYLFDPMHNKVGDLSNPAEMQAFKKSYRTFAEDQPGSP